MKGGGLRVELPSGWQVRRAAARRGLDPFLARLLAERPLEIEETLLARPSRGAADGPLRLRAEGNAARALIARHASGALTLHGPEEARGSVFGVRLRAAGPVRLTLIRVRDRIVEKSLRALAARWERARFAGPGRVSGLVWADARSLARGVLPPFDPAALPPPPARSLLFVHGICSDAASAFGALARTRGTDGRTLLARLAPRYEGRILAFNHPTVGTAPEENVRALLAALPEHPVLFDVVTHSRGGVVLRTLVEAAEGTERFRLGRAALVAAPNEGSALAEPERWATWVSWLANLCDLFPGGFSTGASLVAESLVWLARRVSGTLPGVAALAPGSSTIAALHVRPGSAAKYAAIGASFAGGGLLSRMADAGVSSFFGEANDLVVPAQGAFPRGLAAERAALFGRGGNLAAPGVHHVNLFDKEETVDLLGAFLERGAWDAPPLDPRAPLPFGGGFRGARERRTPATDRPSVRSPRSGRTPGGKPPEPFDVVVLGAGRREDGAQVLASWRGARVVSVLPTRGGAAGERMHRLIAFQERTLASFAGRGEPPGEAELRDAGALLFEALFTGDVLRLYDRARGERPLLDLSLTSSLDWIADKPWELLRDPSRDAFLALDGVRVARRVFGLNPAPPSPRGRGPLRILVVAAQPLGTAPLAAALEEKSLREAFAPLVARGRVQFDVVRRATPARLHERISRTRPDVVHFVGHGEWDPKAGRGALLLEDGRGAVHALDAPALRALLTARGLSLVVLNACETGRGGRNGLARGVAQALVAGGLPAVVANQYPVLDDSAALFARTLASALAEGTALAEGVREARLALAAASGSPLDWAVPVLYAHDPGRGLAASSPASGGA